MKKQKRSPKKKETFEYKITIIPPNSFMVITTTNAKKVMKSLEGYHEFFKERNIGGIIIDPDTQFEALSTEELEDCGLQRIAIAHGNEYH